MSQISAIVAEVTPTGQFPVSSVTGLGQLGALTTAPHAPLLAWDEAGAHFPALRIWLWVYIGMDLLFIAGFALLGITILKHRPRVIYTRWLLTAVAAACTAEAIIGAVTLVQASPSAAGAGGQDGLAWPLHVATAVKWVAVIALIAWVAYRVHASDSQTALDEALRRDITKVPACGAYQPDYLTKRPYCLPGVGDLADLRLLTGQGH